MAKPTVLIVDDDQEVLEYLSNVLKGENWKVLTEKDGDWAVKTFKSRRIDAVVLDILIPVLNGFQVADAIRSEDRGKNVPIIMLSGIYRGAENRANAIERYGLLEYLNKPVEGTRIRTLLKEAIAERKKATPRKAREVKKKRKPRPTVRLTDPMGRRERRQVEREAKVLAREPVALRGNLNETPFAKLLHELYKLQSTGALFLLREKVKKIVYLNNGQPTFIKSNVLRECLGRQLVAEGRITDEQCEESVTRAKKASRLQGAELIEMELLSPAELVDALRRQLETKLFDIFGWQSGEYQFKENAKLPAEEVLLGRSCATIVYQGIQQFYASQRLEEELRASLGSYPAPASDPYLRLQKLELDGDGEKVVEAIDGTRTLQALLDDPRWERRLALPVVYAIYTAGVVDFWDRSLKLPPTRSARRRAELSGGDPLQAEDGGQLDERLAAELMMLKKMDHFRALGVDRQATTEDVEVAYDRQAWRRHPDFFLDQPDQVQELVEGIFGRLRAAYLVLRSPFRRDSYLAQLAADDAVKAEDDDGAGSHLAASRYFKDGEESLRQGKYEEAVWNFRRAVALNERSATYQAHLGWAIHKTGPTDHVSAQEASRHLDRAIHLDPQLDVAHLYAGYLALAEDETDRARESFQKALRCNPECKEAAEELKALQQDS